jgi:DNA polymerase III alpha subunit (gram-positive type)
LRDKGVRWAGKKLWEQTKETLRDKKYIIVYDLETTGLSPTKNNVIEIAAIRFKISDEFRLTEDDTFHTYINPEYKVSERITELTGLTDDFLGTQPTEAEAFDDILDFFEDVPVSGWNNVKFDDKFMAEMYARHGQNFAPNGTIDGLPMARERIPKAEVENYKLVTIGTYFGHEFTAHQALEDVKTTAKIIQLLLGEYIDSENQPDGDSIQGTERPAINSISYWEKFNIPSRIYVNMACGTIYYDLLSHTWNVKDKDVDINELDMEWIEAEAWKAAGCANEIEFRAFRGNTKKAS